MATRDGWRRATDGDARLLDADDDDDDRADAVDDVVRRRAASEGATTPGTGSRDGGDEG